MKAVKWWRSVRVVQSVVPRRGEREEGEWENTELVGGCRMVRSEGKIGGAMSGKCGFVPLRIERLRS